MSSIAALDRARAAVRSRSDASACDAAMHDLAIALGTTRPETGTVRAIRAVVDKLEHPDAYPRDEDVYAAHGAKGRTFTLWKARFHSLALHTLVDSLSSSDILEATAYIAAPERPSCAGVLSDDDDLRALELSNRDARRILREHASHYITRNRAEATYEGWIAQLHPENVRLDERLKTSGCEHQQIFFDAMRAPTKPTSDTFCRSHAGLVEITVGTSLTVAVVAAEYALSLTEVALAAAGKSAGGARKTCIAVAVKRGSTGSAALSTLASLGAVVALSAELAFKLAALAIKLTETLTVPAIACVGGIVQGVLALSPADARRTAERLLAVRRAVRRRVHALFHRPAFSHPFFGDPFPPARSPGATRKGSASQPAAAAAPVKAVAAAAVQPRAVVVPVATALPVVEGTVVKRASDLRDWRELEKVRLPIHGWERAERAGVGRHMRETSCGAGVDIHL